MLSRTGRKKALNRLKGKLEARRSPVEKDQETVPVADAMRAYWERDFLSFAIPAHNGGREGRARDRGLRLWWVPHDHAHWAGQCDSRPAVDRLARPRLH